MAPQPNWQAAADRLLARQRPLRRCRRDDASPEHATNAVGKKSNATGSSRVRTAQSTATVSRPTQMPPRGRANRLMAFRLHVRPAFEQEEKPGASVYRGSRGQAAAG